MAPNRSGPGMEPKRRNMKDWTPRASVRCSSATQLVREGGEGEKVGELRLEINQNLSDTKTRNGYRDGGMWAKKA